MKNPIGEMPFLDHLEELRRRILYALLAVIVGVVFSLWAVQAFHVVDFIQAPIKPYLPEGKLAIFSVTEGVMIELKLGFFGGILLASPVLLAQLWGFLSPALYQKEKKAIIPAIFVGIILFLVGAWVSWTYMVPAGIRMLMNYNEGKFATVISFESYFGQLTVFVVALGASMELPLVMTIFAWIGVMGSQTYARFRRIAVVVNIIAGAIIAPDQSPISALAVAIPLILLYELGVFGAVVIERRKRRRAAAATAALLLFCLVSGGASRLSAQNPPTRPPTTVDTGRKAPTKAGQDSVRNKRLGLPTAPRWPFQIDDSTLTALLSKGGFRVTRFQGDSGDLSADAEEMMLKGRVSVKRDSGVVETEELLYRQSECAMLTKGETQIFEPSRPPAVGRDLRLETCKDKERMVLTDALTMSSELGGDWYLRGNLAVDSNSKRLYMGDGEFTTCALPLADYHFASREVKWIGQSALVARPAVLYVRDVPILWLPFLFQDTKPGRRSGILIPQFGLNDIVRPTRTYNRQVTNMGYYYAPNDYLDITARLDWYANRHLDYSLEGRYNVLNRFMSGGFGYLHQAQAGGGSSSTFHLDHTQRFSLSTTLTANLNYTTNTSVAQSNIIDPLQSVQQITSALNATKKFAWGDVTIGGNRRQTLSDGSGQMTFPSLTISPRQIALARNVSWAPSLTFANNTTFKTPLATQFVVGNGTLDTLKLTGGTRVTTLSINTPLTLGGFNVRMSINGQDQTVDGRVVLSRRVPDPNSPGDSLTIVTTRNGDYRTALDWDIGVELWQLSRGTLNLTPSIGIANINPGAYFIRAAASNGQWVHQGKRLEGALRATPTFYGFVNAKVGPVFRLRHEFSPALQLQYSPTATLPEAYANAISASGSGTLSRAAPAKLLANISLSQNLSAKLRPAPGDTTTDETKFKKVQVFSLSTSGIGFDFEQDKLPGKTGWITPSITNTFQSGLLPGFQFSIQHDLWEGVVGSDTAKFSPFLSSLQAGVTLNAGTFRSLAKILGLGNGDSTVGQPGVLPPAPARSSSGLGVRPRSLSSGLEGLGGGPFTASLSYSVGRTRPNAVPLPQIDPVTGLPILQPQLPISPDRSSLGINTSFSPTKFWKVTWGTLYNFTDGRFEGQSLVFQRDLHDWRATFNLQKSPNGNFALVFSIVLIGFEQDIKFDYQQTTIRPLGIVR